MHDIDKSLTWQTSNQHPTRLLFRQVQSAIGILQKVSDAVISTDVQIRLRPSAVEQTKFANVARNQHHPLQPIKPIVSPTIVLQSFIDASCAFPQLSTTSIFQLPVFFRLEIFSFLPGPLKTLASLNMYLIIEHMFQFLSQPSTNTKPLRTFSRILSNQFLKLFKRYFGALKGNPSWTCLHDQIKPCPSTPTNIVNGTSTAQ